MTDSARFPRRRFTLKLTLGADDWSGMLRELRRFSEEIEEHGAGCNLTSGGPDSGGWVEIIEDPHMTPERYMEQLYLVTGRTEPPYAD